VLLCIVYFDYPVARRIPRPHPATRISATALALLGGPSGIRGGALGGPWGALGGPWGAVGVPWETVWGPRASLGEGALGGSSYHVCWFGVHVFLFSLNTTIVN